MVKKNEEKYKIYEIYTTIQKMWRYVIGYKFNTFTSISLSFLSFVFGGAIYLYGNYASLPKQVLAIEAEREVILQTVQEINTRLDKNVEDHRLFEQSLTNIESKEEETNEMIRELYLKLIK